MLLVRKNFPLVFLLSFSVFTIAAGQSTVFTNEIRMRQIPIYQAARSDDPGYLRWLIEQGADVNATSNLGESGLMIASGYGYMDLVRILVENGADINMKMGESQTTALMRATRGGHTEIVRYLIENGADTDGAMPIAKKKVYKDIVRVLMEAGVEDDDEEFWSKRSDFDGNWRGYGKLIYSMTCNGGRIPIEFTIINGIAKSNYPDKRLQFETRVKDNGKIRFRYVGAGHRSAGAGPEPIDALLIGRLGTRSGKGRIILGSCKGKWTAEKD
jgi:hypothetical protein